MADDLTSSLALQTEIASNFTIARQRRDAELVRQFKQLYGLEPSELVELEWQRTRRLTEGSNQSQPMDRKRELPSSYSKRNGAKGRDRPTFVGQLVEEDRNTLGSAPCGIGGRTGGLQILSEARSTVLRAQCM